LVEWLVFQIEMFFAKQVSTSCSDKEESNMLAGGKKIIQMRPGASPYGDQW